MRLRLITMWLGTFVALCAASARAQEQHSLGLTMGYPASIGVLWHVTDKLAIRPELTVSRNTSETVSTFTFTTFNSSSLTPTTTTGTTTSTIDGWQVGVGVSGLFYLWRWDDLRAYLSPRFAYTRSTSHSTSTRTPSVGGLTVPDSDFRTSSYFYGGSFGAQYGLGKRFGVYGELGLGLTHNTTSSATAAQSRLKSTIVATRSGAGVLFYF